MGAVALWADATYLHLVGPDVHERRRLGRDGLIEVVLVDTAAHDLDQGADPLDLTPGGRIELPAPDGAPERRPTVHDWLSDRERFTTLEMADPLAASSLGPVLEAAVRRCPPVRLPTDGAAKKMGPVGTVVLAADLLKNPWFVAKSRAERTGVALAGLPARVEQERFVLVGHSLARGSGQRRAHDGDEAGGAPSGGIAPAGRRRRRDGRDWHAVNEAVTPAAYNYHSANDKVLSVFYTAAQAGSTSAGAAGIRSKLPRIIDKNVTRTVPGHFEYLGNVTFG